MDVIFPESKFKRIVIVGGGFGGIELVKKINSEIFQVILIDEHNYHTFQPLLYQVATGGLEPDSIAYPIRKIFQKKKNLFFRVAKALEIIPEKNILHTSIGELEYDYLVLATGSITNFFGQDELKNNCLVLKSVTDALDIRSFLLQNFEKALLTTDEADQKSLMNVVVVGGGPTGVEVSGALAELKKHVLPNDYPELDLTRMKITVVESSGSLLGGMSEQASLHAKKFLVQSGVEVLLNSRVMKFNGEQLILDKGNTISTKSVIWTAGVMGRTLPGMEKSIPERGNRLMVDEFNRVNGYQNIFAIGDVAAMQGGSQIPHPMVAPVAIQQGKNLAMNLMRNSPGEWNPFVYADRGTMATVGRNKAVADLNHLKFHGLFAWIAWLFIHLILLVGYRNKLVVLINWMWSYFSYDRAIRLIIRPFKK